MICKICGAVIDDSDKCCLGCGSVLDDDLKDEMVICPNCHCANSVDNEYCVECGSYLFEDTYSDCSNSINFFDIQPEIAKENDDIQTEEPNMYCKECNSYVNMKNGCCAECGAPLNANSNKPVQVTPSKSAPGSVPSKVEIFCAECGTENESDARFCCECGEELSMPNNEPQPSMSQRVAISNAMNDDVENLDEDDSIHLIKNIISIGCILVGLICFFFPFIDFIADVDINGTDLLWVNSDWLGLRGFEGTDMLNIFVVLSALCGISALFKSSTRRSGAIAAAVFLIIFRIFGANFIPLEPDGDVMLGDVMSGEMKELGEVFIEYGTAIYVAIIAFFVAAFFADPDKE